MTIALNLRGVVVDRRALQDSRMIVLSLAVQLDQDGRCAIATAQARDAFDFDPRLAAELGGDAPAAPTGIAAAPLRWHAWSRQT